MKLGKLIILAAGFILVVLAAWLLVYIWGHNPAVVDLSPYDINVSGKLLVSAKVYSLKKGEYLLILTDAESGRREAYWFCPDNKRIGTPAFPTYVEFGNSSVISKATFDGFTYLGEYTADWEIKNNDITFTIKGPSEAARVSRDLTAEGLKREISYNTKIIMKHREPGI
jgi:hypothetical protein